MRKLLFFLTVLFCFSCDKQEELASFENSIDELANIREKLGEANYLGTLSYQNNAYLTYDNGIAYRFSDQQLISAIQSNDLLPSNVTWTDNSKKGKQKTIKIENSNSDDILLFKNIEISDGISNFDIEASNGVELKGLSYSGTLVNTNKCPWCVPVVFIVAEVLIEMSETDPMDVCLEGIKACKEAGGLPSTKVDEGSWWSSASCEITCNAQA